ncbi:MAG: hypothetical protein GXO07_05330, partial [Crenarchaeota archaeon]|nr:hypothetical protein [Thermoproteota archaeon]
MDEAHHTPATTVLSIVSRLDKTLRLGLSATPWREDGLEGSFYGYVGKPEVRVDAELLMEKGYISKFKLLQIYIHIPFSMIEGLYGSGPRALETALA